MSQGKMRVAGSDQYVSGKRARWLIAGGRARRAPNGELEMVAAGGPPPAAGVHRWTRYSRIGLPNPAGLAQHRGIKMNAAGFPTSK